MTHPSLFRVGLLVGCYMVLVNSGMSQDAGSVGTAPETFISPLDADGKLVQFARDIAPILRSRCLKCHGPEDAKNDFRVDDRDSMMDFLEPEDVDASSLYTDYLVVDDQDMLMPPPSHGGPLSLIELALIHTWISEGAVWPDGERLVESNVSETVEAMVLPKTFTERAWLAQGFLHPATVHFPVALLTVGALFVVVGWKWPELGTQIPMICLILGCISAIVASVMGWSFATEKGYGSWSRFDEAMITRDIFWHRWGGVFVSAVSIICVVIAILSIRKDSPKLTFLWKFGLLACAGIVGAVGHQGGEMTHGEDFYPKAWRILTGSPPDPPPAIDPDPTDDRLDQAAETER